jgi:hypothetical protein
VHKVGWVGGAILYDVKLVHEGGLGTLRLLIYFELSPGDDNSIGTFESSSDLEFEIAFFTLQLVEVKSESRLQFALSVVGRLFFGLLLMPGIGSDPTLVGDVGFGPCGNLAI